MFLKRLLILLFILTAVNKNIIAQKKDDYSANWKKVELLDKKGLYASANKQVIIIFNLAVAAENDAQQIKAAMYQIKYSTMVEEDYNEKSIFFIDTLITKAKCPSKNILQSMQAQLFLNQQQRFRYRLRGRTKLSEETSNDIKTWSNDKLTKTITALYKASLTNEVILKNISINGFDDIIEKGKNCRDLRPTLYDFLAHKALDFFLSNENDAFTSASKFILNDEKIFSTANVFIQSNFVTKDSTSHYYNALLLLQDILKFHITDANPDAFIDADITRLDFANKNGVLANKDKLYEDALKDIETKYSKYPSSAQAMYLRAELYKKKGENYDPLTQTAFQFYIKDAKELCEQAIKKIPNSEGGINCMGLLTKIKRPSLNLKTEKVNITGQPFRSIVEYKNITKLYLRVVKTNRNEIGDLERNGYDRLWEKIANLKATESWSIDLPNPQDYQNHSTEIKINALPTGTYMILASINPDFSISDNILARQITYVSNISYLYTTKDDMFVLDRDNGRPLVNAEVQLWQQTYDQSNGHYVNVRSSKYISDKNGYIRIKNDVENNYNYYFEVKYNGDELYTGDLHYRYSYNSYQRTHDKYDFLFTDRSIYRPGQTVFFKGILINKDSATQKSKIIENEKLTIILFDATYQKVGSLQVETNEYGSFNGNFKLTDGALNGRFKLMDSANQTFQYFNVEEYKRPKFSVEIKKPAGTYRVNDSIQVTGIAKAYAGNNIDAAKVVYRIVRRKQYPVWWLYGAYSKRDFPGNGGETMEITNGETITNNNGEFFITFKAIPDETADKKDQPVFYYEISTDITDLNGETRSGNTSVAVAYQSLQLNILSEDKIPIDSLPAIKISSTNMNGLFEKAFINFTVQKLNSPNKFFRERYWPIPDQFTMTKEEYTKSFPYDAYANEDQVSKWPLAEKAMDIADSTSNNSTFNIQHLKLNAGWYKIIVTTKDKYGEEVRAEKYIYLINNQQPNTDEPVTVNVKNNTAEPGEQVIYNITTGLEKIWRIHTLSTQGNPEKYSYPVITKTNPYNNEINITENDRGGINLSYAFVLHNRFYNGEQNFYVPWNNKDLQIQYETFRDKILPGSDEKWKIKIIGNRSEKVAAETLISMYDASLDQYKPHKWSSIKSTWPILSNKIGWLSYTFSWVNSDEKDNIEDHDTSYWKTYDDYLDNGWNDGDYRTVKHMKFPKPVFDDADGDGIPDQEDTEPNTSPGSFQHNMNPDIRYSAKNKKSDTLHLNMTAGLPGKKSVNETNGNNDIQIRKNFNETAFFFPALITDTSGNIEFSFTIPEALTTWKMMTLAHTKDLASVYSEKTVITQKPLMVQPNAPRFLREGDRVEFSTKVVNLCDSEITGTAQLELFDAATNKPVDGWFKNMFPVQYFTAAAGQSAAVKFPLEIPFNFNSALTWRIKAISKNESFSDGEESALPVLTNRILVTETMPLNLRNEKTKNFKFEKLLNSGNSNSLTNHALTFEYTSNPAWYAVQALPYLMEYPYECAEQSFNRYYANTLASYISNSTPKIKAVFEKLKTTDTAALLSNLQKNEAN